MDALPTDPQLGPLDLLVIQPTPFCNIDCSYCYLPDRQSKKQITRDVLEAIFERAFASGLVEHPFTVVWHAGEPCVLPPRFYKEAIAILERHNTLGVRVDHSFQTNGTLIDAEWCAFIKSHNVRIGVSVDGPAFLHDRFRRTRGGKGTHTRVIQGMELLRSEGIPFHVITVLTGASLDYPDELYEFYRQYGISSVGFNVEEIEGPHRHSSLEGSATYERVVRFFARFYDLARGDWPLHVRELHGATATIFGAGEEMPARSHEIAPLAIISVDCEGRFSSFSPELLGLKSEQYGDFEFGRVQTDSFRAAARTEKFRDPGRHRRGRGTVPPDLSVFPVLRRRRSGQQILRERLVQLDGNDVLPLEQAGRDRRRAGQARERRSGSAGSRRNAFTALR